MSLERWRYHVLAIDLDGTILDFPVSGAIPSFGNPNPNAIKALHRFKKLGYTLVIHTARPDDQDHLAAIVRTLNEQQIPFHHIGKNPSSGWPTCKPLADLYIDDRALRYENNWLETMIKALLILGEDQALIELMDETFDCPKCASRDSVKAMKKDLDTYSFRCVECGELVVSLPR